MGYKTTKKHFEIFKKECAKWIEFFGLKDWEIGYHHQEDDDTLASLKYDLSGGWATIYLATEWERKEPTILEVKECAFHEVCELLLARIRTLAMYRFTTRDEIEEATHGIIRRMENSVFEKLKGERL